MLPMYFCFYRKSTYILYACMLCLYFMPWACRGNFLHYVFMTCYTLHAPKTTIVSENQTKRYCNSSFQPTFANTLLFANRAGSSCFWTSIPPSFHYCDARSWVSLHRWVSLIPLASHQRIRRGGCGGQLWPRHEVKNRRDNISMLRMGNQLLSFLNQQAIHHSKFGLRTALISAKLLFCCELVSASDGASSTPGQRGPGITYRCEVWI